MKRILAFLSLVVLCCAEASAQTPQPLYPDGKFDGDNGLDSSVTADRDGVRFGVAVPDYFLFRPAPDKANGQCVVVLPGGGYGCVCYQREGIDVARWLNENGITAVVLRYRMPNGHSEIPLTDVRRMFRTVRENAAEWGIDPCQVGVMGFSAGGHLAATASTLLTDPDTRPDFTILFYPVITMDPQWTHGGSRKNLLGANPSESATERYSAEKQVTDATPPAFIAVSNEDRSVSPVNSVLYYEALHKHRIPAELHIFPEGPHGFGLKTDFPYHDEMVASLARWLREINAGKFSTVR